MAQPAAIAATSAAIRTVLERAVAGVPDLAGVNVTHFRAQELQAPPTSETALVLSILLHRVVRSSIRSATPATVTRGGRLLRAPIPLDLHYLVTAWARSALMQQRLLGLAIRTLEDSPVLPSSVLNDGPWAGVFRDTEAVELVWDPLSGQEESDLWQVAQGSQQPSASYIARGVELDSLIAPVEGALVQTLQFDYAEAQP